MLHSPGSAWSAEECQAFDRHLQSALGLPAALLMENAGAALAGTVRQLADAISANRVLYVVGPGNNGGDALVAARQLHRHLPGLIWAPLGMPRRAGEPAEQAARAALAVGAPCLASPQIPSLAGFDLIVDGLFGLGLTRPLAGAAAQAVQQINAAPAPKLAVDLPSGLDCDRGTPLGDAVRARWTLTFVAPKLGFLQPEAGAYCGAVQVAGIGVSEDYAREWLRERRARAASDSTTAPDRGPTHRSAPTGE